MDESLEYVMQLVTKYTQDHAHLWLDKDDMYWLARLLQEVGELSSVLINDHDGTVDKELLQIASIVINWLNRPL